MIAHHDPDSFIREHGAAALLALVGTRPRPSDADVFPGWARLPRHRLPSGADPVAYYRDDAPASSPDVDREAARWQANLDAIVLVRLRQRWPLDGGGDGPRDFAIVDEAQRLREAERLRRQVATIEAAQRAAREEHRRTPYEQARRFLAGMAPAVSGDGANRQLLAACREMVRGFALPPDVALTLLESEFAPRCDPRPPHRELARLVRWASRSRLEAGYRLTRGPF